MTTASAFSYPPENVRLYACTTVPGGVKLVGKVDGEKEPATLLVTDQYIKLGTQWMVQKGKLVPYQPHTTPVVKVKAPTKIIPLRSLYR